MANEKTADSYSPDLAIPPGETIRDTIKFLGMTQKELADRMRRPEKTISEIINGKAAITPKTAYQLEHVLDIPATFWINLEASYQSTKARLEQAKKLDKQKKLLARYPYAEMARLGWVPKTRDKIEKVTNLLRFFAVASLQAVKSVQDAAFRKAQGRRVSPEALSSWLRKGELEARKLELGTYNPGRFKRTLKEIRPLTRMKDSSKFRDAVELCAKCGVALVFIPHLEKTYVNGATHWLNSRQAIIQLSLRYRYEDIFWFSFFHEAGHIIQHKNEGLLVDFEDSGRNKYEKEADSFACDMLIPKEKYDQFMEVTAGSPSEENVLNFAEAIDIAPSIVVGRLQHDRVINFNQMNGLKTRLSW